MVSTGTWPDDEQSLSSFPGVQQTVVRDNGEGVNRSLMKSTITCHDTQYLQPARSRTSLSGVEIRRELPSLSPPAIPSSCPTSPYQ